LFITFSFPPGSKEGLAFVAMRGFIFPTFLLAVLLAVLHFIPVAECQQRPVFAQRNLTDMGINASSIPSDSSFAGLDWGDVNNDGWPDLVLGPAEASPVCVWVYRNLRNGTFVKSFSHCPASSGGVRTAS
jgi:hypothetical protein